MQELEKILEEIKESSIIVATSKEHYIHPQDGRFVEEVVLLDCVEDIIRKHMNDGWIPVEERLPEESLNSVIGWDAYRERCCFVQYYGGRWMLRADREPIKITHWRPLPDRPGRSKGE